MRWLEHYANGALKCSSPISTTPDLRDVGVSVVRALIPGFQPLFGAPHEQALGGTRLDDVPARLRLKSGRSERALPQTGLPHPFLLKGIDS